MNELALKYPLVPIPKVDKTPNVANDRELAYILNLHNGMSHYDAGKAAGYSEKYINSTLYQRKYKPAFIQRYVEVTKCSFAYLVSKVLKLDTAWLEKVERDVEAKNWDSYTKSKHTLDRISKLAGFVKDKDAAPDVVINIGDVQNMLLSKHK